MNGRQHRGQPRQTLQVVDSDHNRGWGAAWRDLVQGVARWEIWSLMGWNDIRLRYRRSIIGPFWLTISMAVTVSAIGVIYATLFGFTLSDYLPYLASGLIIWTFINTLLAEGCLVFTTAEGVLKHQKIPSTVFVWRVLLRNLIILAHQLPVYGVVAALFGVNLGWELLLLVPGLLLVCAGLAPLILLNGILCTRFRDLQLMVANILQVLFFVTPVIWKSQGPDTVTGQAAFWNPLAHMLALLRAPLVGQVAPLHSWVAVLLIGGVGGLAVFALYARVRTRITYWL